MKKILPVILILLFTSCSKEEITKKEKESVKNKTILKFMYTGPAKKIYLAGNFNKWRVADQDYEFKKIGDNNFILELPESKFIKGKNEYKLIVDGEWKIDPYCNETEIHQLSGKVNIFYLP